MIDGIFKFGQIIHYGIDKYICIMPVKLISLTNPIGRN